MEIEFYPYPGVEVPVTIDGERKGKLLKLVFELDCEYPLGHKRLRPDLINRPIEIDTSRPQRPIVKPYRLARHQKESFRLISVKYTDEEWKNEIFYKWKWPTDEESVEDRLDISNDL